MARKAMTIAYAVGDGLYLNVTNRCPCACEFCIRKEGDGAYGSSPLWLEREPTADEIVAAAEAAEPGRFREIVFCGYGEPTERLDTVLEVARRLKSLHPDLPIRVNTNGLSDLIAGAPTAARFAGAVDRLSVSLNAATAGEYLELCHPRFGLGSYEAVLGFAAEAKRHVLSVVLTVVASEGFTPEKEAACRAVAARVGVPLRVRQFIAGAQAGKGES